MANAKCIMMNLSLLNLIEPTSGDRQAKCKVQQAQDTEARSYKMINEALVQILLIPEEQKNFDYMINNDVIL